MTVDETGVDETVVDETGVDELGINLWDNQLSIWYQHGSVPVATQLPLQYVY